MLHGRSSNNSYLPSGSDSGVVASRMRPVTCLTVQMDRQGFDKEENHMSSRAVLDFYASPGLLTSAGRYEPDIAALPDDIHALIEIVQGIVVHQFVSELIYGVTLPDARKQEGHIRPVEQMI